MNIYVGNLSYDTGNAELQEAFSQFGAVDDARVIEDRNTGRSRGFGFVEMADAAEAKKAIAELNGTDLQGRTITANGTTIMFSHITARQIQCPLPQEYMPTHLLC